MPDGNIDGIAMHWAKKGYIVVAPTYRKRALNLWQTLVWETPYEEDNFTKAVTDAGYQGDPDKVGQFFADRLRDLKTIADNLDTIVNQSVNSATWGSYNPASSEVALAGHSFGAITTVLASGIAWKDAGVVLDMEGDFGFRRINNGGTPSDISDDSGPFIDAKAFLAVSGATFDGVEEPGPPPERTVHTVLDATRPNLTGRDMISKPFMLIAGSKDILVDAAGDPATVEHARLYDPVTEPFGLHDAARYGVIIDGANHLTAVGWFHAPSVTYRSWVFQDVWNFVLLFIKGSDSLMPEEQAFFDGGSVEAKLEETIDAMFKDTDTPQDDEEDRAEKMQEYSLALWDAYLSPRYDIIANKGSEFLGEPESVHRQDPYIYDVGSIHGFVRRDPTHAFVVRDNSGTPLVQFQDDGNVLISSGTISRGIVTTSSSASEFIVKASNGTNLMRIDSGGLRTKGYIYPLQPSVSAGAGREFSNRPVKCIFPGGCVSGENTSNRELEVCHGDFGTGSGW